MHVADDRQTCGFEGVAATCSAKSVAAGAISTEWAATLTASGITRPPAALARLLAAATPAGPAGNDNLARRVVVRHLDASPCEVGRGLRADRGHLFVGRAQILRPCCPDGPTGARHQFTAQALVRRTASAKLGLRRRPGHCTLPGCDRPYREAVRAAGARRAAREGGDAGDQDGRLGIWVSVSVSAGPLKAQR